MACNTKAGPAAAINYVEQHCGVKITQTDWHSLRVLAQREEEGTGSRAVATPAQIESTVESLSYNLASEAGADRDHDGYKVDVPNYLNLSDADYMALTSSGREYVDETQRLEQVLRKSKMTVGSLEAIGYIAAWGADEALDRARAETARQSLQRSIDKMTDDELKAKTDTEFDAWEAAFNAERAAGTNSDRGPKRESEVIKERLTMYVEATEARGLVYLEPGIHYGKYVDDPTIPVDADKQAALDALDRKVARERKRLGLPPVATN